MYERLTESEMLIMECFWQNGELQTNKLSEMVSARSWQPTTLLTFLSRLVKKSFLCVKKQGKSNTYTPNISKDEYRNAEGKAFLEDIYEGDIRNFLASMVSSKGLTNDDIENLRIWLKEQEGLEDV